MIFSDKAVSLRGNFLTPDRYTKSLPLNHPKEFSKTLRYARSSRDSALELRIPCGVTEAPTLLVNGLPDQIR
jgi:hypothetical protein